MAENRVNLRSDPVLRGEHIKVGVGEYKLSEAAQEMFFFFCRFFGRSTRPQSHFLFVVFS